jgi:hypothetical protein
MARKAATQKLNPAHEIVRMDALGTIHCIRYEPFESGLARQINHSSKL